jgi:hypothetical protein
MSCLMQQHGNDAEQQSLEEGHEPMKNYCVH